MTPDEELKLLRADWAALVAQVSGGEGANFTGDKEHPNSVMRQALDALSEAVTYVESPSWSPSMADECRKAIDTLRAALGTK
jgi:uncharacterized sporulation protein YeaH/YhbH (DUF444 family)